jgi:hypothetical protein
MKNRIEDWDEKKMQLEKVKGVAFILYLMRSRRNG